MRDCGRPCSWRGLARSRWCRSWPGPLRFCACVRSTRLRHPGRPKASPRRWPDSVPALNRPGASGSFAALAAAAPLRTAEARVQALPPVAIAAPDLASVRTGRCARVGKRFRLCGEFRAVRASDEPECQPQHGRIEGQQKKLQEQERQEDAALDAAAERESETLERAVGLSFE